MDVSIKISEQIAEQLPLKEGDAAVIDALIPVRAFKKGSVLLEAGQVARDSYFIIEGCVRSYYLVEGEDRTTAFYVEGDPVASLISYNQQIPADHFFSCVEDSVLAILNFEKEKELYEKFPALESMCRQHIETEYGKQQQILSNYLTKSPEERYLLLQETNPDLLHRVPQYILATYLGVQPESLSRIRKRIARKQ